MLHFRDRAGSRIHRVHPVRTDVLVEGRRIFLRFYIYFLVRFEMPSFESSLFYFFISQFDDYFSVVFF